MPQQIQMSDKPLEDIKKLSDTIYQLMNFGILHEEAEMDMAATMLLWTTQQDALVKGIKEEMVTDEVEEELYDYIQDNYGTYHFQNLIEKSFDKNLQTKAALMFRHIIANILNQDMYQDNDAVLEECLTYFEDEL